MSIGGLFGEVFDVEGVRRCGHPEEVEGLDVKGAGDGDGVRDPERLRSRHPDLVPRGGQPEGFVDRPEVLGKVRL
jgi:hypothetical protein